MNKLTKVINTLNIYMSKLTFDLISDLNLTSMIDVNWENKATSLYCIVAGNISSDRIILFRFLEELSFHYETVFFLDGDLEHDMFGGDFDSSYASLKHDIDQLENVIFLHENIIIMNGATLLATNGWTTFNFTNRNAIDETIEFLEARGDVPTEVSNDIFKMAVTDQHYMGNSIDNCQTMADVQNIIIITNSVPIPSFVDHDAKYDGTILGDTVGNNGITDCLVNDTECKVSTWIFGKYPGELDYNIDGIRFVNNPKGSKDNSMYYPKIIQF